MRLLVILFLSLFSFQIYACPDFPVKFSVSGSSFAKEEFQLKKSIHGAVFSNNGTDLYFNYAKHSWCLNDTGAPKEKEHCLAHDEKIILTDSKDPSKKIGVIQIGKDERTLLLKSVDSRGNPDLTKPYLKISDNGLFKKASDDGKISANLETYMLIEMVTSSGVTGKAELKHGPTNISPDGSVSYPRFRSIGVIPKEATSTNDLSGQFMTKKGCGYSIDPYNAASDGAATKSNGAD